ncbi:glutathione S-transferase [Aspergillus niger CBS 101883]|uniref:Contig An16c0060, genomic contig n=3 Tax=Aspergillus niger TaxID=5061 RepID=A2R6Y9_ASPNC|nr:uncharacterized protein An16g01680 [Aspergillus niger]XP_025452489.1 glutathione S-transferase [Aspergillus niger CBS 101883]PYH54434.1 glutathione S-transferase [Aspergillus niger CBS 101883]RDH18203.1 glutathione S-transferase [Aspergillus niger ATCC 13496]CAK42785.1 unnamed protein product [Aspergillus niger]
MTTPLEVWGRRDSSNVQAVMWCIAELNLPYLRHDIGQRFGGNNTPEFLAMNPNGRIPVLRDGASEPLWESGAINRYLASAYGSDEFWPQDPRARAQIDKWAEWAKVTFTPAFSLRIWWQLVRVAPSKRDPIAIREAVAGLDPILDIAEAQLTRQKFLAGDVFTLADVQFGHLLFRYFSIDIERKERPGLQRYYEALKERPAYREHVMTKDQCENDLRNYSVDIRDPLIDTYYYNHTIVSPKTPFSDVIAQKVLMVHRDTLQIIEAMKFGYAVYKETMLSNGKSHRINGSITDDSTHDESYYGPGGHTSREEGVTSHLVAAGDTGLAISLTTPVNLLSEQKAARGKHSSGKSRPSRDLENQFGQDTHDYVRAHKESCKSVLKNR